MEVGSHRIITENEHIVLGISSYEEVKTFKYLGPKIKIILTRK
jgi:hypothetical protein